MFILFCLNDPYFGSESQKKRSGVRKNVKRQLYTAVISYFLNMMTEYAEPVLALDIFCDLVQTTEEAYLN